MPPASPPARPTLVLACDILTGVGYEPLAKMQRGRTRALVNTALVMPASFTRDPDVRFPLGSMEREIEDAVGPGDAEFLDATKLATSLMGDSIATNLFMVGYAFQRGLPAAVGGRDPAGDRAERHRDRVEHSARSSGAGSPRVDPARVAEAAIAKEVPDWHRPSQSLDGDRRAPRAVPHRLPGRGLRPALHRPGRARAGARAVEPSPARRRLAEAVARYHFKLLAIKDEYEVARLYTETEFLDRIAAQFEGDYTRPLPPGAAALRQDRSRDRRAGEGRRTARGC